MTRQVVTITTTMTAEVASRLMSQEGVGCLVVLNSGGVASGIITERDLVSRVLAKSLPGEAVKVGDSMSAPLVTISSTVPIEKAAEIMFRNKVRRLPVMDGDSLVGIITATDLEKSRELGLRYDEKTLTKLSRALSRDHQKGRMTSLGTAKGERAEVAAAQTVPHRTSRRATIRLQEEARRNRRVR